MTKKERQIKSLSFFATFFTKMWYNNCKVIVITGSRQIQINLDFPRCFVVL